MSPTSSPCVERTPRGSDERVREPTDAGNDRRPATAPTVEHDQRRYETDECSTRHVAGVVDPDEVTSQSNCRRAEEVEDTDAPTADEEDGEGDCKGRDSMVARKGWLVRGSREKRLRRMSDERSLPHQYVRDRLRDEETETRRRETREASDLPAICPAGPVEEPEGERRDDEEGTAQKVTKSSTSSETSG